MSPKNQPNALVQGTLDMLILKALSRDELHGYAVAQFIQSASDEVLRVEEGALYPALHRLEVRGLLTSEWGASDNNRKAKYYELTRSGRNQLAAEREAWGKLARAVALVLEMS